MNKRIHHFIGHLPMLILFLLIFLLNQFVYMYGDDFRYAAYFGLYPKFQGQEVTLENIIKTQIYDYTHMNGRFITNVLSVLLLVDGIELWRVLNPIFVTLFAYAIFYVVFVRLPKKEDFVSASMIALLLLSIHPYISRQTIHYAIGSMNYVYPLLLLFLLASFLRRYDIGKSEHHLKIAYLFLPIIGFMLGMSQEQCAALGIMFLSFWLIQSIVAKKRVKTIHVLIFLFTIAGALCLFLAPGPKIRAMSPAISFFDDLSLIEKMKYSFPSNIRFFVVQQPIHTISIILLSCFLYDQTFHKRFRYIVMVFVTPLLLSVVDPILRVKNKILLYKHFVENDLIISLYGLCMIVLILILNFNLIRKTKNYLFLALSCGFLAANLMMVFTPFIAGGRVAFPAIPFAICFILLLWKHLEKTRRFTWIFVGFLFFIGIGTYTNVLIGYADNAAIHEERMKRIEETRGIKQGVLELPALKSPFYAAYELSEINGFLEAFRVYHKIDPSVKLVIKKHERNLEGN